MDFMIGTVDSKRLRKDLLQHFRTAPNWRTPEGRRKLEAVQYANEQQLVALAKQEGYKLSEEELAAVSGGKSWSCTHCALLIGD